MKSGPGKNTARRAILGFAIAAAIFFLIVVWIRPWLALGVLFFSHMLMLWPTMVANSQGWGAVVTCFATPRREVWLTIDDGPDPKHTPRILDLLRQHEAKATFFLIGERALAFPAEAAAIRAADHSVGNHTFSHPGAFFWCFGPKRIAEQIDRCGFSSEWFRSPAGLKNFVVHPVLARRNMQLIGWTVRGLDTVSHDPGAVAARILRQVRPGAIILLHEAHRTESDPDFHLHCLELTLLGLTKAGYRCVLPAAEQLQVPCGGR